MIFLKIFRACHARKGVFVDSGANEGTWSLLAAAHGCTAVAIEPQPYCAALLRAASERSGFNELIHLHNNAFVDNPKNATKLCVPLDMCRGTATYTNGQVTDIRSKDFSVPKGTHCVEVPFVTLDELVPPGSSVDLWHLDVEGAELVALRSARKLLLERRILRIMMEVDSMQRWRLHVRT